MSRGRDASEPRVLLLDNHDSFTWNLAHYLEESGAAVQVEQSDAVDVAWVLAREFDGIVLSPGPGRPEDAGISESLVRAAELTPLLGVCLGHQAIARVHGARVVRGEPVHGKTSLVEHDGSELFRGLPQPFAATRYHSLRVDPAGLDPDLVVSARTADGVVMGLRHRVRPLWGVQFHPEAVLTVGGKLLVGNFVERVRHGRRRSDAA
jgi:anthranilate synthase/aminodeoxychorismate synthase-like glutamine amidotransferase